MLAKLGCKATYKTKAACDNDYRINAQMGLEISEFKLLYSLSSYRKDFAHKPFKLQAERACLNSPRQHITGGPQLRRS